MMVVMTDGQHNMGPEPVIVAEQAAREDIVINTVTFSDGADFVRMKEVAAVTGGQHFHATSAMELEVIFRELAATLPVLLTQ